VTQHKGVCGKLEERQPDRKEGDFALCKLLLLFPNLNLKSFPALIKKSKTLEFINDQHLKIT
jgi:hypothetical protein